MKNSKNFTKLFATLSTLPVAAKAEEIVTSVLAGNVAILSAATGSGKTLYATTLLAEKSTEQVVVLVPRRFLAVNAAETVAELAGITLGREVGYCVGKQSGEESKFSSETKLLFVTYGYAISSGLINRASTLVLDEVHEADMDMSICKALLQRRIANGEGVKLMEMSATINAERQAEYWNGVKPAKVFEVEGSTIPCNVRHEKDDIEEVVMNLIADGRKGILVFRPGVADVKETAADIAEAGEAAGVAVEVSTIYGDMDAAERRRATAAPKNGVAKVLVGTNVVESGVNLMWLDAGVTCGTGKLPVARDSGAVALELVHLSKWRLEQQKGRLTRSGNRADKVFGSGEFVLVSSNSWEERDAETLPEIVRLPLTELVMHCARFGLRADQLNFDFPPSKEKVKVAEVKLQRLGLITEDCKLTKAGQFVCGMPVGPETGAMLWHAKQTKVLGAFLPLAAVIEADGVRKNFRIPHGCDNTSDYLDGVKAFNKVRNALQAGYERGLKLSRDEREDLFERNNIGFKRYEIAKLMLKELKRRFNGDASSITAATDAQLRQCITAGSIDQIYKVDSDGGACPLPGGYYRLGNGSAVSRLNSGKFAVGKLKTIVPRNGRSSFTVFEKATKVTLEDIEAVAKIRGDVLSRTVVRNKVGYYSFENVTSFTIFGEDLIVIKEESPLTDEEENDKFEFELVRDPLKARLEDLNQVRESLGMETIRCGDATWQIGFYGNSCEYADELVAEIEDRMKAIVLECASKISALSEARREVELNSISYTDEGFKFDDKTYAYTAEGLAQAEEDSGIAVSATILKAENTKIGYARIEKLNVRRAKLELDAINVDSDEEFKLKGNYKHVSNLDAIAELEAEVSKFEAEAEAAASDLPSNVEIWKRRGGRTNAGDGWVIQVDGSFRQRDKIDCPRPRYSEEGTQVWNQILPGEVVLKWKKHSSSAEHELEVIHFPKEGLTESQLERISEIMEILEEEWKDASGMASGAPSPSVGKGWVNPENGKFLVSNFQTSRQKREAEKAKKLKNKVNFNSPFASLTQLMQQD